MDKEKIGFQKKSITKYLNKKVDEWVGSVNNPVILQIILPDLTTIITDKYTDPDKEIIRKFRQEILSNVIVTGGAIASMLQGDMPNDVDIYFKDIGIAKKIAKYYLLSIDINYFDNEDIELDIIQNNATNGVLIDNAPNETGVESVPYISENAISLKNDIQLILRFTGDVDMIHSNFDFLHATNYWTESSGVVYNIDALEAILEKRLKYIGSKYPVSSIFRLRKFISRGWKISAGEIVKMCYDVSRLDLNNVSVLKQQTLGMDSLYFLTAIRKLESGEMDMNRDTLFNVINEVFDDPDFNEKE